MLEKCEAALKSWPKWNRSLEIARVRMERKYGDVTDLVADAKVEYQVIGEGTSSETTKLFINEEQWTKWEIETELEVIASDFVKSEIGLPSHTELHDIFVDIWVSSISPVFKRDIMREREAQRELDHEDNLRVIQLESKVKDKKSDRVWNSVSWYQDAVSHREVGEFLQKLEWPFDEERVRRHGGGRPREEDKTNVEAIVCYVLRYRAHLKEWQIARKFGWKTRKNDYGKLESRQVRKLLKRGKDIMKEPNHGKNTT